MKTDDVLLAAQRAVLLMAAIKAATDAFDRGDTNLFDALDAVRTALESCGDGAESRREAA